MVGLDRRLRDADTAVLDEQVPPLQTHRPFVRLVRAGALDD
ncbi:hypothetical protein [Pseudonocardia hierapolitana]|nr:hypothetical protein [Pseudonocardia hierapolitana]